MRSSTSVSVGVALLATAARGFLQGRETTAGRYVSLILRRQVHMILADRRRQRTSVICSVRPTPTSSPQWTNLGQSCNAFIGCRAQGSVVADMLRRRVVVPRSSLRCFL